MPFPLLLAATALVLGGVGFAYYERKERKHGSAQPPSPSPAGSSPATPAPAPAPAPAPSGPVAAPSAHPDSAAVGHYLRDAWNQGLVDNVTWVPIDVGPFTLEVAAEPLSVQGLRVPASMNDAVAILKIINAILPTKEIADAIWQAAARKLTPSPLPAGPAMQTWADVRAWNAELGPTGNDLAGGGWKHWILANPMGVKGAVNYGLWKSNGTPWQSPGRQHDPDYYDETQLVQPVRVAARAGDTDIDLIDWLSKAHGGDEIAGSTGRELGGPIATNVLSRFREGG